MENVVKTVLYCYPLYDEMMEAIEDLVLYKALKSFSNTYKTVEQAEKIIMLNEKSKMINQLKNFVESIFPLLTNEERQLLDYKYFQKKMDKDFDYKSRKYYRHQLKLKAKLIDIFTKKGFTEEYFQKNYFSIYFLKNKYMKFKKMSESGIRSKASTDRIV